MDKKKITLLIAGTILTVVLIFAVIAIVQSGFKEFKWPPAILIPVVGMLTFFGTLALTNVTSTSPDFSKGEIRKAIAASLLSVYFFVMAVTLYASSSPIYKLESVAQASAQVADAPTDGSETDAATDSSTDGASSTDTTDSASASAAEEAATPKTPIDLVNTLLDGFNKIILAVVGFYFAGRTVEEVTNNRRGETSGDNPNPNRKPNES